MTFYDFMLYEGVKASWLKAVLMIEPAVFMGMNSTLWLHCVITTAHTPVCCISKVHDGHCPIGIMLFGFVKWEQVETGHPCRSKDEWTDKSDKTHPSQQKHPPWVWSKYALNWLSTKWKYSILSLPFCLLLMAASVSLFCQFCCLVSPSAMSARPRAYEVSVYWSCREAQPGLAEFFCLWWLSLPVLIWGHGLGRLVIKDPDTSTRKPAADGRNAASLYFWLYLQILTIFYKLHL